MADRQAGVTVPRGERGRVMNVSSLRLLVLAVLAGVQIGGCPRGRAPQGIPPAAEQTGGVKRPQAMRVLVCPVQEVPEAQVATAAQALAEAYGASVEVGESLAVPEEAYHQRRRQYLASLFLTALCELPAEATGESKLLAVTTLDLYVPELNFVFGQAQRGGRAAVVSVARLDPRFFGAPADEALLRHRLKKEAVHEVGHCLGLTHCPDRTCVMYFSNSLADTDHKQALPCADCRQRLGG